MQLNQVIFVSILKVCLSVVVLDYGKKVYEYIVENEFQKDVIICNILIDMYVKCGQLKYVYEVFDRLKLKDVVIWNVMIVGYIQQGLGDEVIEFYVCMCEGCFVVVSNVIFIIILKVCGSVGVLQVGKQIYIEIL